MKNVLIAVLGVFYLQVVLGDFSVHDIEPLLNECLNEVGMSRDAFMVNLNIDISVVEGVPDFNNVIFCVYKKGNFLNDDDTLNNDQVHKFMVNHYFGVFYGPRRTPANLDETATNAIDACKTVQGTDKGDTLVKNYNCIVRFLTKLEN